MIRPTPENSKKIPHSDIHNLYTIIKESDKSRKLPYNVGVKSAQNGSLCPIKLVCEDCGLELILNAIFKNKIHMLSEKEKTEDCDFIILRKENDEAWYIEHNQSMSLNELPTLIQNVQISGKSKSLPEYTYRFKDGSEMKARNYSTPVKRPDRNIEITHLTKINDLDPHQWYGLTKENDGVLLRWKDGNGRVRVDEECVEPGDGELFVDVFVGRNHPGTRMNEEEILSIFQSFDFIDISDSIQSVPRSTLHDFRS